MNLFRKSKSEAPNAPAETTPAVAWADVVPLRAEHAPGSAFNVRGANYLKDKVKVPSAEPIYLFTKGTAPTYTGAKWVPPRFRSLYSKETLLGLLRQ